MTDNPFAAVLKTLWSMLLAHPQFVRDVKDRNRIRFDSPSVRDPLKETVQVGDLPEVAIGVSSASGNLMSTSSTSSFTRQYSILVSSGDMRYSELLANVEWQVFVAMLGWKGRLSALEWRGQRYVKRVNVVGVATGLSDPKANRNIQGWSTAFSIEVEMHFRTDDLLDELDCPPGETGEDLN